MAAISGFWSCCWRLFAVIFIGMTTAFLGMAQGEPEKTVNPRRRPLVANRAPRHTRFLVLCLGLNVPAKLSDVLHQIATTLGGAQ
jgi:hypothetical protein